MYIRIAPQLTKRDIAHQGLQVEANATALVLKLVQLPPPSFSIGSTSAWQALLKRLLSVSLRVQGKGLTKSWMAEFVFYGSPLTSNHPKEQGKFLCKSLKLVINLNCFQQCLLLLLLLFCIHRFKETSLLFLRDGNC